ncbi:MFS transporter [Streptomyces tsukubensis]|uniref:MFS transporter n=1 Tax=Streptomyces tsukubensis TaxID=83656 RepID=A0A1V4A841_9ACTN|nr:MFS transporter [Streptomyces tsukubensis]OON78007.1 MFS transporter [Streptomyces tsukubensis]QFR97171.1 DHA2 family efflux MFS transporter permease subunit [Streptomyces tsukubensis]
MTSSPTPAESVGQGIALSSARGRWVLACAVLASGIAMLDGTVVNVALPTIGRDLDASLSTLQWVVSAYMLTLSALLLLGGALGDRLGRRRTLLVGVVWFAVASMLCGIAQDGGTLIAARALQGVGGALLTPGSLALVRATFRPDDQAKAVGAWSGLTGVAGAVGPFLGGWLIDGPGWRWIFLINVPLAAVVVAIAISHVPESRDVSAAGHRFDFLGACLGAAFLAGISYALITAAGASALAVAVPALLGLAAGVAFVLVERRAAAPMLPLGLLRSRLFGVTNVMTLCLYAAIGGILFLLPVQLQNGLGYDALEAGVATLPITLLMLLLSARAGALAQRVGPTLPLAVGPVVAAAGVLLMWRIGPGASYATDVLPAVAVLGLGMSTFVAPLTATVLASVESERAGLASGVNNTAARIAQLLVVAALPLAVGLSDDAYRDPGAVDTAFHRASAVCAGLFLLAALAAALFVRPRVFDRSEGEAPACAPQCRTHVALSAPPLEPGTGSAEGAGGGSTKAAGDG